MEAGEAKNQSERETSSKPPPPPEIITVDSAKKNELKDGAQPKQQGNDESNFPQARTPKHANKTLGAKGETKGNEQEKQTQQASAPGDTSKSASEYTNQEKESISNQHPGAQPQAAAHPYHQGQPRQHAYYTRNREGFQVPPEQERQALEGPRRQGQLAVGGVNGAFSPHESQFRDRDTSNYPRYYNSNNYVPTVSPGAPTDRVGEYRAGVPYYNRAEPQRELRGGQVAGGYSNPQYRPDDRHPPQQHHNFSQRREHHPGDPQYSRYEQGSYGRHPSHYGGQHQHPLSHPRLGRAPPQQAGFSDQHRTGQPQYHGRPPHYPHHQHHVALPSGTAPPADFHRRQTPTHDKAKEHGFRQEEGAGFTRAVSSSFDKSVKSRNSNEEPKPIDERAGQTQTQQLVHAGGQDRTYNAETRTAGDNASEAPSDDSSWRQLNQVTSVDEDVIRARLKEKIGAPTARNTETPSGTEARLEVQTRSTSSSLTNSPNEQANATTSATSGKDQPPVPTPSKLASLDSLSSVASAQEPMNTEGSKDSKNRARLPSSPGSSHASLDLMKCSSGSSGLLQGFPPRHQRDSSDATFGSSYAGNGTSKRKHEESDVSTNKTAANGDSKNPQTNAHSVDKHQIDDNPAKRNRTNDAVAASSTKLPEGSNRNQKESPVSIGCSPSNDGGQQSQQARRPRNQQDPRMRPQSMASHARHPSDSRHSLNLSPGHTSGSYFDQAPAYSYSLDSGHSLSKEEQRRLTYPSLPPRPGSSASTMTPPNHEGGQSGGVGLSMSSWDIQNQESFGAGSLGGGSIGGGGGGQPFMSSFSFTQDYPGVTNNESGLSYNAPHDQDRHPEGGEHRNQLVLRQPYAANQHGRPDSRHPAVAESRNQSFEDPRYHGNFERSHNVDQGYSDAQRRSGRPAAYGENHKQPQYSGQYPPHAPSWGTTTSTSSTGQTHHQQQNFRSGHYGQYHSGQRTQPPLPQSPRSRQLYAGAMMRNYSEDSARTSPPPGPHGHQLALRSGNFQPPPEFAAPQNPHLTRRPPPAVFIMSTPPGGHPQPHARGRKQPAAGVFTWSKDDDARLSEVMKKYKNPRNWEPIAKEHGRGKTAKECHERWIRYLKPGVRKGQWQDYEDAIVLEAVTTSTEQPFTRWSDLAQRLPGRVGKQIRDRWVNHLNPGLNHMPFSKEEDLRLWEGHKKLGKRWVEISSKFFNSTRSENHIKNRWYSAGFKKLITNEIGPDAYASTTKPKKEEKSKSKRNKPEETVAV